MRDEAVRQNQFGVVASDNTVVPKEVESFSKAGVKKSKANIAKLRNVDATEKATQSAIANSIVSANTALGSADIE